MGDRFVLLESAGQGGMARVWRAQDLLERRFVAVKRILPALAQHDSIRALFEDEGRIQSQLEHRHAVRLVDRGSDAHGPWMALEWVEGTTARAWVHPHRRLGFDALVQLLRDVFSGLEGLHSGAACLGRRVPVLHRDLAPTNVLLGRDGVARVADFGLARSLGLARTSIPGTTRGKPGYLAPEVLRGGVHSTRADLYATGVIAWELLTGHRLFQHLSLGSPERARALLHTPRPSAFTVRPEVPAALGELVDSLLAMDPARRPTSAAEARACMDSLAPEGRLKLRAAVRSVCRQRARMERLEEMLAPETQGNHETTQVQA